jgi:high-affinity iron transporter
MTLFLQAAAIVLREGLEVLLVIAAVTAYLRARQSSHFLKPLFLGVGLALLAAVPLILVLNDSRDLVTSEGFQGFVLLAAAFLMLFISGWLFVQRSNAGWSDLIRNRTQGAVASQTGYVFILIAFLVVFREAAETVLFLEALSIQAKGFRPEMAFGIAAALTCLVIAGILIFSTGFRLPLKTVFLITSAMFFLTGVYFIGDGLGHLQLQKYISTTPIGAAGSALNALGLNASWEAVVVQASIVLAALTGLIAGAGASCRTISGG